MKKGNDNHCYISPDMEIVALACEQAFLSASTYSVKGADNEEFVSGGTFSDWM